MFQFYWLWVNLDADKKRNPSLSYSLYITIDKPYWVSMSRYHYCLQLHFSLLFVVFVFHSCYCFCPSIETRCLKRLQNSAPTSDQALRERVCVCVQVCGTARVYVTQIPRGDIKLWEAFSLAIYIGDFLTVLCPRCRLRITSWNVYASLNIQAMFIYLTGPCQQRTSLSKAIAWCNWLEAIYWPWGRRAGGDITTR